MRTRFMRDPAAIFFGAAAVLTLLVSIPATYAVLAPFHDSGGWGGIALALFAVAVFEVGAVGAKLITLAIPQWSGRLNILTVALLLLTTLANYAHGADLFAGATLAPTLTRVRAGDYAAWAAVGAAALFPALLYVWLAAFVARVKALRQGAIDQEAASAAHAAALAQALAERDAIGMQLRQALADQAARARSVERPTLPDRPARSLPARRSLPADDRRDRAIAMHRSGDHSIRSIARSVGASPSTVRSWLVSPSTDQ